MSSGGVEDSELRESVTKKPCVDTDMEISAIETRTNAKLEVDRTLDTANKTLHRLLEEIPLVSEAVTKAAELNSIQDKRVYIEVYENGADAKIISGKWVLKPHKARYVLSDVVYARPPFERQPETLDPKGTVVWKLQKSLYGLRSAPRRWQDHLAQIFRKCGFVTNVLNTCLWTHTTKRVSLLFHVDDLLLAATHQIISEVLAELSRDLELKGSEVTTKPTRYLGRTLVKTAEGYNLGVDVSYVESMLEELNMSAFKSSPTFKWERRETDEKEMPASEQRVHRQLVGKLFMD